MIIPEIPRQTDTVGVVRPARLPCRIEAQGVGGAGLGRPIAGRLGDGECLFLERQRDVESETTGVFETPPLPRRSRQVRRK